ncbi:Aldehyde dehydrogenase [Mycena indigotica]|uniref:Aldehyde dehydrogenase n=1 Tax=Mycena indigotica TaxID=2126181 RepID=A0A8H6W6I9_9AGAR|nr:Aldehyde dehydrogenase [Mycena indigotica]KAF7306707.1 Aldehyde dehydrogenase [Mycena indigotica]
MASTFTYEFKSKGFTGKSSFPTGLFIDGKFQKSDTTLEVLNPANGQLITKVDEAHPSHVDQAVKAARKAFETTWGLNASGELRAQLLNKLGQLMERDADELAAIEALDNDAGWADKALTGQTIETDEKKLAYTRYEPLGVPSEFTPLTALRMCSLIKEAGFPDGVVNVLVGFGPTVGAAISEHMSIEKVAFTGSTLVGRKVMAAAANSNLKNVTLELGGKSPNIIFDDADLDQAVSWAAHGIFWNHGQACCAGSRIFVQAGIYDQFLAAFTEKAKAITVGDPFDEKVDQGPQVSQQQFDRIMGYIDSGKADGATVHLGGGRVGKEGYFIEPTIFTDTNSQMKIVQEEIFGPVGVIIKFTDEQDVIRQANDTLYGLAAAVFSQNINRAIETAHKLQAGTAWVNCVNQLHVQVPFGGYKQSGIGRELGEHALANYVAVKSVHVGPISCLLWVTAIIYLPDQPWASTPSQTSLPTILDQFSRYSGRVLPYALPYESRPPKERRARLETGEGIVLVAHCVRNQNGDHQVTVSSGFALDTPNPDGATVVTCAHTLEELRRSTLLANGKLDSGSFVVSAGPSGEMLVSPVSAILAALPQSDLLLLQTPVELKTLPVSPYPAPRDISVLTHFVSHSPSTGDDWTPWIGGSWRKCSRGKVVSYRDFAGRETEPGTYDSLANMFVSTLPTSGSSGGPIVDEETGAVVGVILGTRMDSRVEGVRGWGTPSEAIFEMFSLPLQAAYSDR